MWIIRGCMYKRALESYLQELASKYSVVTILGPRESGKTTLVRASFPTKPYVNMEDADNRSLATIDPKRFIENYPDGAIFDEVQRTPHLLSYIQVRVDELGVNGMYTLRPIQSATFRLRQNP